LSGPLTPLSTNRSDRVSAPRDSSTTPGDRTFDDYFRTSDPVVAISGGVTSASGAGYFKFGGTICYGRPSSGVVAPHLNGGPLPEVLLDDTPRSTTLRLPLDLSEVVTNLRRERYTRTPRPAESIAGSPSLRTLYYAVRPVLGIGVRKHLQRLRLSGWDRIRFPQWPVDASVETLMRNTMALALKTGERSRYPFIWFWPDGAEAGVMMTHDVEGPTGVKFCDALMDLDESYGIASSFQIVPASGAADLCAAIRGRGFELNLHDWNHDGRLFRDKRLFLERAALINAHARRLGCRGFRSAAMYREQDWFDALEFDYDMSVPNVAHLDPQRGGCCTVMPYFVGDILELPLTTVQDYSLLHIIGDYSISLWKTQIELILAEHGLISFIVHPDYVKATRANAVYIKLLAHLERLRAQRKLWVALPGEIEQWWRQRNKMRLVRDGAGWRVDGCGSERARVAYAALDSDRVVYQIEDNQPRPALAAS